MIVKKFILRSLSRYWPTKIGTSNIKTISKAIPSADAISFFILFGAI